MTLLRLEEPRALEQTIHAIQHDGVVAFPTDTVYGIAASLTAPTALRRIFEVKGRSTDKTLPILMSSSAVLNQLTDDVDPRVIALAMRFWPGPLTVIMPGKSSLPPEVRAADGTIGVRVPDHSVALTIANRCGGAIAVTSANPSGGPPALKADDIQEQLGEAIDIVLDGGIARGGRASTVIRIGEDGDIEVVREGDALPDTVRTLWGDILKSGDHNGVAR
jgi:L-threonylcarbamoyladenylate synthase